MLELLAWIEIHKKKLIAGVIVLAAVGFGIYVHLVRQKERETEAAQALMEKRPAAGASATTPRMTPAEYLEVARKYPGTSAAEQAELLAARGLFTEGQYAEAQTRFEKFAADHRGGERVADAQYGVAACLDARKENKQALAKYQEVATRYPSRAVVPFAQLASARIYETTGQPELALKIYDEIPRAKFPTVLSGEARMRREALLQKYPNLAPTNAPIAAVSRVKTALESAVSQALTNASATNAAPQR